MHIHPAINQSDFFRTVPYKKISRHHLKNKSCIPLMTRQRQESALLISFNACEAKIQNCTCKKQNTIKSHAMARRQQNQAATTKKQHKLRGKFGPDLHAPTRGGGCTSNAPILHQFVAARKRRHIAPRHGGDHANRRHCRLSPPEKSPGKRSSERCGGKIAPGCRHAAPHTLR